MSICMEIWATGLIDDTGTKAYRAFILHVDDRALVMFRYGRPGKVGRVETYRFEGKNGLREALNRYNAKIDEKSQRTSNTSARRVVFQNQNTATDAWEIVDLLGEEGQMTCDAVPRNDLAWLTTQVETDDHDFGFDEDERPQQHAARVGNELRKEKSEAQQKATKALLNNPNFGRF